MQSTYLLPAILHLSLLVTSTAAAPTGDVDLQFDFTGFAEDDLTISDAAQITPSGLLQLTDTKSEVGHAFFHSPIPFDNDSRPLSFSTTFVFAVVPKHHDTVGHGIALVLSPATTITGSQSGHYLGLFNNSSEGDETTRIVAVELDTYLNEDFRDIDNNHVGIDVHGMTSRNSSTARYFDDELGGFTNLTLANGEPIQVWIEYDDSEKKMNVTISPQNVPKPSVPLLEMASFDLWSLVSPKTFVGFSSSTASGPAAHYILGWSFRLNGEAPSLDSTKFPPLPSSTDKNKTSTVVAICLSLSAVMVLVLFTSGLVVVMRRRRFAEALEDWEVEYGPHRFSYKDLYDATNGFKAENIIGSGGFGLVYKGVLHNSSRNQEVAVKKVSHTSRQGMKEFVAEIASMGRLRHRNLVQLLGYCRRRGELLLIYDYMPNGSLDKFLFTSGYSSSSSSSSYLVLNWGHRVEITKGVAAGLLYLHEGWDQVVVHRDIKAANVLLDREFNGKLSDFGLARLYEHGSDPQTTHVVGTFGYIAPELTKTGKATTATDVYAFGCFLLEVVCGRRPTETRVGVREEESVLVDWVLECWRSGTLVQVVDPKLRGEYVVEQAEVALKLGLLCSHPEPASRPSIRQVVEILEGDVSLPPTSPNSLGDACNSARRRGDGFDDYVTSNSQVSGMTVEFENEASPIKAWTSNSNSIGSGCINSDSSRRWRF